jgi:peroxiredoxin
VTLSPGATAPSFTLTDTDGRDWSVGGPDVADPAAVVFTCNHCPYAIAWHERILEAARDYDGRARFLLINSNDAGRFPRDSPEAMRARVAADGGWPAPYLHDADQSVARSFGAKTTPDVFVLDAGGILRYRGAPDADYADPSQRAVWLREALDAILAGREPDRRETKPVGCSIKWKR